MQNLNKIPDPDTTAKKVTITTNTEPNSETGEIVRNESFFSENLRNPKLNPLLLTSLNRLSKLEERLDNMTNEEAASITVSDASLFAANFRDKSPVNESM